MGFFASTPDLEVLLCYCSKRHHLTLVLDATV